MVLAKTNPLTLPYRCYTVAYEMALEQIIADLDDLEERVENLNVDQKTNEDILLNVLKRVDETEKDLRKVRCETFPCGH